MKNNSASLPRRYFVDGEGQRVLIGLSLQETSEFERLDSRSVQDEIDVNGRHRDETRRWSDLYTKHDSAWRDWIEQNRVDHARQSDFN